MSKGILNKAEIWKKQRTYPNLGLTENNLLIENTNKLLNKVIEEKIINYIKFKLTAIGDSKNSISEEETFFLSMYTVLNKDEKLRGVTSKEEKEGELKENVGVKSYKEVNNAVKLLFFSERPPDDVPNLNSIFNWMKEGSFNEVMLTAEFLCFPEKQCKPHLPKGFLKRSKLSNQELVELDKYLIKRNNQLQKLTTELMKLKKNKANNKISKVEKKISPY